MFTRNNDICQMQIWIVIPIGTIKSNSQGKSSQNIYSDAQENLFFVHQCRDLICRKPITFANLSLAILDKILNAANDKLVTQVLCFMFSPLLSNVSH